MLDNQINKHIFYHLEKLAFVRNLFYNLKHNWMIKVPAMAAALVILILVLSSYHLPVRQKRDLNNELKIQTAQTQVLPQTQQPAEKKITYKLTTRTTHRKTVGRKINELLASIKARPVVEGTDIMKDDGIMTSFHFLVNKNKVNSSIKTIKTFDNFEVKEEEDTSVPAQAKEDIRIEIWVKRKNAN